MNENEMIICNDGTSKNEECSKENTNTFETKQKNELRFKKKLIKEVQKHRALYDTRYKGFSSADAKINAWQEIATALEKDVEICKQTWIDLRYNYQNYVRKLRKFLHSNNMSQKQRPVMKFERDLLFLWRFVADRRRCRITTVFESKNDISPPITQTLKEDIIVEAENIPDLVINVENNDKFCSLFRKIIKYDNHKFVVTPELIRLIELLKEYPELYDTSHTYYNSYYRKGIIWTALATEFNEKASELMKLWLYVQARFEWEMYSIKGKKTDLINLLSFLKRHTILDPNTVNKQSCYLKTRWYEPLDNLKHIVELLLTINTFRNPILFTPAKQVEGPVFNKYTKLWRNITDIILTDKGFTNITPGQCEVTWLIMRKFHWELVKMRKHGYQLKDNWHFECIMSDLYDYTKHLNAKTEQIKEDITSNSYAYSIPILEAITVSSSSTALQSSPNLFTTRSNQPCISQFVPISNATPAQSSPTLISTSSLSSQAPPILSFGSRPFKASLVVPTSSLPSPAYLSSIPSSISTSNVSNQHSQMSIYTDKTNQIAEHIIFKSNAPNPVTSSIKLSSTYVQPSPTSTSLLSSQSPSPSIGQFISTSNVEVPTSTFSVTGAQSTPTLLYTSSATRQPSLPSISPLISTLNVSATPAKSLSTLFSASSSSEPSTYKEQTLTTSSRTTPFESSKPEEVSTSTGNMLYPNKMKIELVIGPGHNLLIVDSPTKKYLLPMKRTAVFIRYVMAIPHLHNKELTLADTSKYWEYLAKQFDLPAYVCIASWDFLSDNFQHFDRIAPLKELMRPFPHFSDMAVWKNGDELCKDLDKLAITKGWIAHIDELPAVMTEMSLHPEMYIKHIVPTSIFSKFPKIPNVAEICFAFKNAFISYMQGLEKGIARKWPQKWWRVLVQLAFLVHIRYSDQEPYYYIVKNKIHEEIERCTKVEKIKEFNKTTNLIFCEKLGIFRTYLISDINFDAYMLILHVRQQPYIYLNCTKEEKLKAWKEVAQKMNAKVSVCHRVFKRALKDYLYLKKRDVGGRCTMNFQYFKHLFYIYDTVKHKKKISVKEASNTVFPERFIPDINMDNSRPKLVMKNWNFGIQNLPATTQKSMRDAVQSLFSKYQKQKYKLNFIIDE